MLHLVVALAFLICGCKDSRRGIFPGEIAPDVAGVDISDKTATLHGQQGKVILVNFWATWCAPCVAELPALQAAYDQLKDKGFVVVGVAVDDTFANVKEAVARYKITYPILIDEAGESKRKFEIRGLPESFVLDSQRKVLVINDPADGTPVTKIIGPREWSKIEALQVFQALVQ
jgi:peroxiredoxin